MLTTILFHIITHQSELAVHLSLLSLAHHYPLPLQVSCELSRAFNLDIRRALLHMQWRLSWKQLPMEESDCSSELASHSFPTLPPPISTTISCPWKQPSEQLLSLSGLESPELVKASIMCDFRAAVDCIDCCPRQVMCVHQPWLARLRPSVLDQLPDSNTLSCACSLGNNIHQLLSQRLCFSTIASTTTTTTTATTTTTSWITPGGDARSELIEMVCHPLLVTVCVCRGRTIAVATAGELFPLHWSVRRRTIFTDCLPYLKLMYITENQNRSEMKRRR